MQQTKLFLLGGPVFVVLTIASIFAFDHGNTPGTDAGPAELASFYGDHAVTQGLAAFVLAASVPFLVLYGIGLLTSVGTREGAGPTAWGYVLLTGVILAAGAVLVAAFAHFGLVNAADEGISPTALQALNSLDGNSWMTFNPAFGVLMLGAAGALLTGPNLRWLGWIALVLGVAAFIPFADFVALLATFAWIVVASIVLARTRREPDFVAAPGPA